MKNLGVSSGIGIGICEHATPRGLSRHINERKQVDYGGRRVSCSIPHKDYGMRFDGRVAALDRKDRRPYSLGAVD